MLIFNFFVIIYLGHKIRNNLSFAKIINIQAYFSTINWI
jgi:hypothetical protein